MYASLVDKYSFHVPQSTISSLVSLDYSFVAVDMCAVNWNWRHGRGGDGSWFEVETCHLCSEACSSSGTAMRCVDPDAEKKKIYYGSSCRDAWSRICRHENKKNIIMGALFRILGLHFWRTLHFVLYNMNYPFLVSFVVASLESRIGSIPWPWGLKDWNYCESYSYSVCPADCTEIYFSG